MLRKLFEQATQKMPISVMTRLLMGSIFDTEWIDALFEKHRERQYSRELLFSTVVEMMSMVTLGVCHSLHSASQTYKDKLNVSLSSLYDKINRTEPKLLQVLVRESAMRLAPVLAPLNLPVTLPGYRMRVVDGNHLPSTEKRLTALKTKTGAALPGHTLVVYDLDQSLVTDIVPCEDAYTPESTILEPLLARAQPGDVWIADRHFCLKKVLMGWQIQNACFIVREAAQYHPRLAQESELHYVGRCDTGEVYEQTISLRDEVQTWRRIDVRLDHPTSSGETRLRIWSNLPAEVGAQKIADLYRRRWRIEGMFQRLEADLKSEIRTLGHPRAALLGFATAILAYNILALLKRVIEQAHQEQQVEVSTYYMANEVRMAYYGMMSFLPPEAWNSWIRLYQGPALGRLLLQIARYVDPQRIRVRQRGPKKPKTKSYTDSVTAHKHFSSARAIREAAL
ncbi:IS4 family transposase [Mycoavidus sp. HKI]|uniref:IS4 family transposase n=1 Tax=Mycoavidus sp. HKI TaxID=2840467 RepID=UPI001CBBB8FD|nr:IS4 family transposase [Mycoavidus sp. HKI]UAW63522.1 IS4 family transposase [Mycoavidus sp. HKI]